MEVAFFQAEWEHTSGEPSVHTLSLNCWSSSHFRPTVALCDFLQPCCCIRSRTFWWRATTATTLRTNACRFALARPLLILCAGLCLAGSVWDYKAEERGRERINQFRNENVRGATIAIYSDLCPALLN